MDLLSEDIIKSYKASAPHTPDKAILKEARQINHVVCFNNTLHDEEELRDIVLAHLNGHYEGDATGETFRKHGKMDIRIEDQNRAAFVGECKVWRGAKELTQAVNQLLSYLTWRDCKAALLLFNRDVAGFSAIQEKVPDALKQHPKYRRQVEVMQPGGHHIFTKEGVEEILNLQPKGRHAKPYQVKQTRHVILKYRFGGAPDVS